MGWGQLLTACLVSISGSLRHPRAGGRRAFISGLGSLAEGSQDVSAGRGLVWKKVLRRGDYRSGRPRPKDEVDVRWEMRLLNGSFVGSSRPYEEANGELFRLRFGAEPPDMIAGWELAMATMLEGEVAEVLVRSPLAFGERGLAQLVPPGADINCTLELVAIVPAPSRRFQSVGVNESISEELVERIQYACLVFCATVLTP